MGGKDAAVVNETYPDDYLDFDFEPSYEQLLEELQWIEGVKAAKEDGPPPTTPDPED